MRKPGNQETTLPGFSGSRGLHGAPAPTDPDVQISRIRLFD